MSKKDEAGPGSGGQAEAGERSKDAEDDGVTIDVFFQDVAVTCIRYLGMSFDDIYKLTVREYLIILEALKLRLTDEEYKAHKVAWLSFAATAKKGTKKHQKPVYDSFKKFYDYESALKEAGAIKKKTSDRFTRLSKHLTETRHTADKED